MRDRLRRFLAICFAATILPSISVHALTWVEVARLTDPGGAAYDGFGVSVAIDGDVAVVGDPKNAFNRAGIARVFVRSGGIWSEAAELLPSDSFGGDQFGFSVAIRADTIAVGSPASNTRQNGRVYVFVKPSGGWSGTLNENALLDASSLGLNDLLGFSVAVAGDSIVSVTGSVLDALVVFNKPASGWSGTVLPSALPFCSLNGALRTVAASGDVIIAGDPFEASGNLPDVGKAFVWVKPAGGWSGFIVNAAELLPSDPVVVGSFGWAVSIDGNTALVTSDGSPLTDDHKGYIFVRPSGGWAGTLTEDAQLIGSDLSGDEQFGFTASISGDTAVVGAPRGAVSAGQPYGAAYVFGRPASGWSGTVSETVELIGPQGYDSFGGGLPGVAISGNTLVVSSADENINGNDEQGAAYVFELRNPFVTRTRFLVQGPIRVAPGVPVEFRVLVEALPPQAPVAPTGIVIVGDGAGEECRAVLNASAEGSCALSFPRGGTYQVRAHYLGNAQLDDSTSSTVPVLVGRGGGS